MAVTHVVFDLDGLLLGKEAAVCISFIPLLCTRDYCRHGEDIHRGYTEYIGQVWEEI